MTFAQTGSAIANTYSDSSYNATALGYQPITARGKEIKKYEIFHNDDQLI
jgi:hypothetical protein